MQGLYPNWMAESSLIRQQVDQVNALMGARDVIVDVTAAAEDGGWGGGPGSGPSEIIYAGIAGGGAAQPKIVYKEPRWPVVIVKRVLSKDEEDIDVILLGIEELNV